MGIRWRPAGQINKHRIPQNVRVVLFNTGSLTQYLQGYCAGSFNLQLLDQGWQTPLPDERRILRLPEQRYALVREINLRCASKPWVYGRSIIPAHTLSGREQQLYHWGQRSLGDYLFSAGRARRSTIDIGSLDADDDLFQLATAHTSHTTGPLWARRSLFYIRYKPLLVVEVFFPDVIEALSTYG